MRALCVISGEGDRSVRYGSLSLYCTFLFKHRSKVSCRFSKSNGQLPLKGIERGETKKKGVRREDSCSTRGKKIRERGSGWQVLSPTSSSLPSPQSPSLPFKLSLPCLALSSLVLSPHRAPRPPNPHALSRALHHPSPSLFALYLCPVGRNSCCRSIDKILRWRRTSFLQVKKVTKGEGSGFVSVA